MKKYILGIGSLVAVFVLVGAGCMATQPADEEEINEEEIAIVEEITEEVAGEETTEEEGEVEEGENEEVDLIDAAIESGDPAECDKLEDPVIVEACKGEIEHDSVE